MFDAIARSHARGMIHTALLRIVLALSLIAVRCGCVVDTSGIGPAGNGTCCDPAPALQWYWAASS
jgi:hypothetical protein